MVLPTPGRAVFSPDPAILALGLLLALQARPTGPGAIAISIVVGVTNQPCRSPPVRVQAVLPSTLHAVIKASAPALTPRLWYGQPAYAKDGKVVCFFQPAQKFNTRYATLGFSDEAHLDEGAMWPTSFALMELTAADEARIGALVKKAVS